MILMLEMFCSRQSVSRHRTWKKRRTETYIDIEVLVEVRQDEDRENVEVDLGGWRTCQYEREEDDEKKGRRTFFRTARC
jgi:hypothetical protein